jgi:hypothetical protein
MKQSAEDLQKKPESGDPKDQQSQKDQQEKNQQQASRSLRDVADETGKVDQDQRKQAAQKKMASQMDDLREAMRRAKQRGKQGGQSPFGKNRQPEPGLRPSRRRWPGPEGRVEARPGPRPGSGARPRSGSRPGPTGSGPTGSGPGPGPERRSTATKPTGPSDTYGDGHDDNLVGDATGTSGNTKDESVSGAQGKQGPVAPRDHPVGCPEGLRLHQLPAGLRRLQEDRRGRHAHREGAGLVQVLREEVLHQDQAAFDELSPRGLVAETRDLVTATVPAPPPLTDEKHPTPMTQAAALAKDVEATVASFTADLRRVKDEIAKMIVGQDGIVEGVLMCLLGGGHALLEGVPGLGKTMLVRTMAETIHATSRASSSRPT